MWWRWRRSRGLDAYLMTAWECEMTKTIMEIMIKLNKNNINQLKENKKRKIMDAWMMKKYLISRWCLWLRFWFIDRFVGWGWFFLFDNLFYDQCFRRWIAGWCLNYFNKTIRNVYWKLTMGPDIILGWAQVPRRGAPCTDRTSWGFQIVDRIEPDRLASRPQRRWPFARVFLKEFTATVERGWISIAVAIKRFQLQGDSSVCMFRDLWHCIGNTIYLCCAAWWWISWRCFLASYEWFRYINCHLPMWS